MTKGFARAGFDKDLLFGQAREDAFMRTLLGGAYIEHKADEKARETGNLYIEFETSSLADGFGEKKPSGIAVTTATRWAQEFDDNCWILVPTARILRLVDRAYQVWGGDNNRFHGALIPWRWLLHLPDEKRSNGETQMTL
jgi:hypothetical protein